MADKDAQMGEWLLADVVDCHGNYEWMSRQRTQCWDFAKATACKYCAQCIARTSQIFILEMPTSEHRLASWQMRHLPGPRFSLMGKDFPKSFVDKTSEVMLVNATPYSWLERTRCLLHQGDLDNVSNQWEPNFCQFRFILCFWICCYIYIVYVRIKITLLRELCDQEMSVRMLSRNMFSTQGHCSFSWMYPFQVPLERLEILIEHLRVAECCSCQLMG